MKEYSSVKVTAYIMLIGSLLFLPFLPNENAGGWSGVSALGLGGRVLCSPFGEFAGLALVDVQDSEHRPFADHFLPVPNALQGNSFCGSFFKRNPDPRPNRGRPDRVYRRVLGQILMKSWKRLGKGAGRMGSLTMALLSMVLIGFNAFACLARVLLTR